MCGITCLIDKGNSYSRPEFEKINNRVIHRGPDGQGLRFFNPEGQQVDSDNYRLAMGHTRLSIIDLSDGAAQPMPYDHDNLWITYNGEIYNYLELRKELAASGYKFLTYSDTEVILAAYSCWGSACFEKMRGMWGLVLYDVRNNKLVVSRDRLSIKPVYFYKDSQQFIVTSEIKQFKSANNINWSGNPDAAGHYLSSGFEKKNITFFKYINVIPPGTFVEFDLADFKLGQYFKYWDTSRLRGDLYYNADDFAVEFLEKLNESIKIHLRSDVPVGCELSGGLDSSSILAKMTTSGTNGLVHSFSSEFPGYSLNERPYMDSVLARYPTESHYDTPDPEVFTNELDQFIYMHDEPVGSLAMYANYSLARRIHETGIKVVLNGQGADEILGGYWQSYYSYLLKSLKGGNPFIPMNHLFMSLLPGGNEQLAMQFPSILKRFLSRKSSQKSLPLKFDYDKTSLVGYYLGLNEKERRLFDITDLILPRLLKWDDRNLMAFSVEGRYPFLDHELIELCLSADTSLMFKNGWTKRPLRKVMEKELPYDIVYRKSKYGYVVPQEKWLSGPLKPVLINWVNKSDLAIHNVIDGKYLKTMINKVLNSHTTKNRDGFMDEDIQFVFRSYLFDTWMRVFNVDFN